LGLGVLALLFSPWTGPETRRWLEQKIFGEQEEFGYPDPQMRTQREAQEDEIRNIERDTDG
jgi:hypothetical protein